MPELRQPKVPVLKRITRKPLFPGDKEIEDNPRSRSAQLRIFEKI
ncbi:MAG TPA: 16S rRNA (cytosine(1402)-N(4))-methyltransferase [Verrucomicrobiales bacterium]|nr:16S rRNA (cytosine(1402)-N(4))-methyltransferase [Verrucomicrobiales bacterium]